MSFTIDVYEVRNIKVAHVKRSIESTLESNSADCLISVRLWQKAKDDCGVAGHWCTASQKAALVKWFGTIPLEWHCLAYVQEHVCGNAIVGPEWTSFRKAARIEVGAKFASALDINRLRVLFELWESQNSGQGSNSGATQEYPEPRILGHDILSAVHRGDFPHAGTCENTLKKRFNKFGIPWSRKKLYSRSQVELVLRVA